MSIARNKEQGLGFEDRMAARLGAEKMPGSGNKWYARLDLGLQAFLLSLKHTRLRSYDLTVHELAEIREVIHAPGGVGGDTLGALLVGIGEGEDEHLVVVQPLDDWLRMVTEQRKLVVESKAEARKRSSTVPVLLREDG